MLGSGSGGSAAIQAAFDGKQNKNEKGQANGYAGLGSDGKVPSEQLPASQGGAAWGGVTGTLSDQTDLQTALDTKAASTHDHDADYAAIDHDHAGVYEPANAALQAHVAAAHAPSDAQKNSDITKAEIEAKLTGEISSHTHAGGGGVPTVKSGLVTLTAGGTAAVLFATPFGVGVTPQVTVSAQFNTSDTSTTLCAHTITNLGFTIRGAGNAAGDIAWIATNAGNA